MMELRVVHRRSWTVCALGDGRGGAELLDFLEDRITDFEKDTVKLLGLLELVADEGPLALPKGVSKPVQGHDGLYEFKAGRLRVAWFYDSRHQRFVCCTHGFLKTSKTDQDREFMKAAQARKKYLAAKAVTVLEDEE